MAVIVTEDIERLFPDKNKYILHQVAMPRFFLMPRFTL